MPAIKMPKASNAAQCLTLEQLPNVGPAMAGDLRRLGLHHPAELVGHDALALYRRLEGLTGKRQDPCVLDTLMAVVDFMQGAAPQPWWGYTAERKRRYGALDAHGPGQVHSQSHAQSHAQIHEQIRAQIHPLTHPQIHAKGPAPSHAQVTAPAPAATAAVPAAPSSAQVATKPLGRAAGQRHRRGPGQPFSHVPGRVRG